MSTTKNLRGFLPARKRGSGTNSTGFDELPIVSGDARSMFCGDLIKTSLGNVEPVSADADFADGVFMGCHYVKMGNPNIASIGPLIRVLLTLKLLLIRVRRPPISFKQMLLVLLVILIR